MKKKLSVVISLTLIAALLISASNFAFAAETETTNVMAQAETRTDLKKTAGRFIAVGEYTEVSIPEYGADRVVVEQAERHLASVKLPSNFLNSTGEKMKDGKIEYAGTKNTVLSVQVVKQEQDGVIFDGIRHILSLKNTDAPTKYEFDYELTEGYRLITAKEYLNEDTGEVFILDETGEIAAVIDPATATDEKGNAVPVSYKIEGNVLEQNIETTEDTAYPITVTSTTHPSKSESKYLTKAEVKKAIDGFEEASKDMSKIGEVLSIFGTAGTAMRVLFTVNSGWCKSQKAKYQGYYNQMNSTTKKYLKITTTYRWRNGGKNSGYVPSGQTYKLVANKNS